LNTYPDSATQSPKPQKHSPTRGTREAPTSMGSSERHDIPTHGAPIAVPGRNCWKRPVAGKVSFLVDGDAYFSAFAAAVERAQFSVLILSWDIDSRLQLRMDGSRGESPNELGLFLKEILSRRKKLQIHVLTWDFAMIYLLEREFLPVFKRPWRGHRRVHFRLDAHHPSGGSHHQKVVVIDDAVAFSGGLDLTKRRWDTPEHKRDDPRRVKPGGFHYEPFHDVQMAVSGEAASALGELARERWRRATGISLFPPPGGSDPWPDDLTPDLEEVPVAIARTEPEWNGYPGVLEVESLFLDMIAAARHSIYIENQYFTSARICDALIQRLTEQDGPDIVMIMAERNSGWLEQNSMGIIRAQLLQKLKRADRFGHLYLYQPALPGGERMEVHSKVIVVDDRLARVGSANLSNRSTGLDTECDLMIESTGEERIARGVAAFRNRLLGEHLGVSPEQLELAIQSKGSLGRGIEKIRGGERTLIPLPVSMDPILGNICLDAEFCDPERPVSPEMIIRHMLPEEFKKPAVRRVPWLIALVMAIFGLAIAWRSLPLGAWIHSAAWMSPAELFEGTPLTPLIVFAVYVLGSFFMIPFMLVVLLTGFWFGPFYGFLYGWAGGLLSASVLFGAGQILGRETVRRLGGRLVNRISYRLVRHGFLAVAVVQILPIAPFTLVNLVAGASRISFADHLKGTLVGLAPLVLIVAAFGDRMMAAIRQPGGLNFLALGVSSLLFVLVFLWLRRISQSARVFGRE
jgi:phospholipase D1/2